LAVVCALAGSAGVAATAPAWSVAYSPTTNGCYIEFWTAAWNAQCSSVTQAGKYRAHVDYNNQPDYTGSWVTKAKNWSGCFDSGQAWFNVQGTNTYVSYTAS
jgi:hypothetical protein